MEPLPALSGAICRFSRLVSLLLILCGANAYASCPAANLFTYSFLTAPSATLAYNLATGISQNYTYVATNPAGQSQSFTIHFVVSNLTSTTVAGVQMPAINNLINSNGSNQNNLMVGGTFVARTPADFSSNYVAAVFDFPVLVRDFSMQINDVDYTINQFRDWLFVKGSTTSGGIYSAALTTPFSNNNTGGPHIDANSTVLIGAATVPVSVTVDQAVGTSNNPNTQNHGTVFANFIQPVNRIEARYGNYPLQPGETATGQQAIGFETISFCPTPVLMVTKTVTPYVTDKASNLNKNIPGADMLYTITVTNSNSSPIDGPAIVVSDNLPPQLLFYNGDIDGSGPLTTNYAFNAGSSGLTFVPANLTYSQNFGVPYNYTPSPGYDPNVNSIQFKPQGSMAPNSTFSFTIRTQIK